MKMENSLAIKTEKNNIPTSNFDVRVSNEEKMDGKVKEEHDFATQEEELYENTDEFMPCGNTILIKYEEDFSNLENDNANYLPDPLNTCATQQVPFEMNEDENAIETPIESNDEEYNSVLPNTVFIKQEVEDEEESTSHNSVMESTSDANSASVVEKAANNCIKCPICQQSISHKYNIQQHMRTHVHERPYKCTLCPYSASHKAHLTKHLRIHSGDKPYKCRLCDYSTARNSDITRHMRIHTGEKPHKCTTCEYSTAQKAALLNHMKIHTGEKPFECTVCDYSASTKGNVVNHMKIHTGEKPYKCTVCDYTASQKITVKCHMRIHTGEKPFKCADCEYTAAHKISLKRHMKIHLAQ